MMRTPQNSRTLGRVEVCLTSEIKVSSVLLNHSAPKPPKEDPEEIRSDLGDPNQS